MTISRRQSGNWQLELAFDDLKGYPSMVTDDLLSQLSDTQKVCLRLVASNHSSKEIAQETGLSYQTVDQYISRAVGVLGAANRREAARILGELEAAPFSKSEFKPVTVAADKISPTMASSNSHEDLRHEPTLLERWIPAVGGKRHALKPAQVIQTILRVSLLTMGTAGAIIAIVFWLNRLML